MSQEQPERLRRYADQCRELAKVAPDDRFRRTLVELAEALEAEVSDSGSSGEPANGNC